MKHDNEKHGLEGAIGQDATLHGELLAQGHDRFPEESYQLLLQVGATCEEALAMLGYDAQRRPLKTP